ncbi:MAG: pyruvate, phosphate dikinase [Clostridia bacterium]|nr:pyruvate, phosphate dikinase [Clostridia bacterium]
MFKKFVYLFKEGDASKSALLGGKGANLCEMTKLGMPVPVGFVISTEACLDYNKREQKLSEKIIKQTFKALKEIEGQCNKIFGSSEKTLILAIRSGARISMPGMMDTILNLGLNDEIVEGFATQNNSRFAYDCYRRLIQMYGNVVKNIKIEEFEKEIEKIKKASNIKLDSELTEKDLKNLINSYKLIYKQNTGKDFPQDIKEQLIEAIQAVFRSWFNPRAILYRRINNIPDDWGTAVNVQQMIFGNLNEKSGTGVAFTRNPSTGENKLYGEFLLNAQGEDVVAGIRTPCSIEKLNNVSPEIYNEFIGYAQKLENHYKDMQDMEFTIESGKLYMLQTRNGKRTPKASIKIAVDLVGERKINKRQALLRLEPNNLESVLHPILNPEQIKSLTPIASGLPASPGGACGKIAFSPSKAIEYKKNNQKVILVRLETSPEDIEGMTASKAILTARGGMTSHAAVVARGMGVPCVTGCGDIEFINEALTKKSNTDIFDFDDVFENTEESGNTKIDEVDIQNLKIKKFENSESENSQDENLEDITLGVKNFEKEEKQNYRVKIGNYIFNEGDIISIDGSSGNIYKEEIELLSENLTSEFATVMEWVKKYQKIGVRANADTPQDAGVAFRSNADGIGLCRTEHMFFGDKRIQIMREMIFAENQQMRKNALNKLMEFQKDDFINIFKEMKERPVTIRFLDPPLHEFLPKNNQEIKVLAENLGKSIEEIEEKTKKLHEFNPMMGHRGLRLAITYPEIYEMQTSAIINAALEVQAKLGFKVEPEIMIPLTTSVREFCHVKNIVKKAAEEVIANYNAETGSKNVAKETNLVSDIEDLTDIPSCANDISEENSANSETENTENKYRKSLKIKYKIGTMIETPRAALLAGEIAQNADFFSFGTNDLTQLVYGFSRDDSEKFLNQYLSKNIFKTNPFEKIDEKGVGKLIKTAIKDARKTKPNLQIGICGEHGGEPDSINFFVNLGFSYVSCSPYRIPIAQLACAIANLKKCTKRRKF